MWDEIYLLLTEQEVCMGESWPRSWVQTERNEVCTHDRGQDSPIQSDYAQLIMMFSIWPNKKTLIRLM